MPNYKFKCLKCGHEFQKLLPSSHEKQKCIECGHCNTQKILEAPGVQFLGKGFYKTDSLKKSIPEKPKKESKQEGKSSKD